MDARDGSVLPVPDTQRPPGPTATPTLHTCPECGGILEPTTPPWQAFVHLDAVLTPTPPEPTGRWQCLICGYRKP